MPCPPHERFLAVERSETGAPLTFWRRPWVQNVLPLATSLALHAAVLLVAGLVYGTVRMVMQTAPLEEQRFVPSAEFVQTTLDASLKYEGVGQDPTRPPTQDEYPDGGAGWATLPGAPDARAALPGGEPDAADALIGLSTVGGTFSKGPAVGPGRGDGRGPLAPFGLRAAGGDVGFVRQPTYGAPSIVFVCDASGSMLASFGTLKAELARTVSGLKASQQFNIIFFQDEKCLALGQRVQFATPENRNRALRWLENVSTTGTTNPIPALELAFADKPKLIYLLTDADFPDNLAVKRFIDRQNPDRATRINTIIFCPAEDASQAFVDLMKRIAKDNNGTFGRVSEDDLKDPPAAVTPRQAPR